MSKEFSFSVMPTVSISRSRFVRKFQHKTSFRHGELVPLYVDEVLPGDTRSIDLASLVRMSTPIAPIMDNIYMDYFAFFVPNRLVWDHWKDFMGENRESAGIPSHEYSVPYLTLDGLDGEDHVLTLDDVPCEIGSLGDYFGLGGLVGHSEAVDAVTAGVKVSALPFRGYYLIYNEWFRNQNIIAPVAVQTGDDNEALIGIGSSVNNYITYNAAKMADYFTKSLPYAQKGQAVSIPLGTTAPVIANPSVLNNSLSVQGQKYIRGSWISVPEEGDTELDDIKLAAPGDEVSSKWLYDETSNADDYETYIHPGLKEGFAVADLTHATAATINQLRYAFQLQKLFERDSLFGSRYWELLAAHFGVTAPDASLQRPEYLGGYRQRINIDQVLSTAGYDSTTSTTVGAPGANSVTASKGSLFTKSFVEHGYIFILGVCRHDHTYSAGVNRMWSKFDRYDYYFPVFANLGAQDVKRKEITAQIGKFAKAAAPDNDAVFGYQEAWAEYRYKPSIVSGLLNPLRQNSLDFWTLADKPLGVQTLDEGFITESENELARAVVTGVSGPDYICDLFIQDIAVRPMPTYSIPGLIDHH